MEKYSYDAFGQPTITDWYGNPHLNADGEPQSWYGSRFMFQGREYLSELGIYDYRNRIYFPGFGRFLQPDPTGFAGDLSNMYRYCGGDPVNFTDPSGLLAPFRHTFVLIKPLEPRGTSDPQPTGTFDPTTAFFKGAMDWGPFEQVMQYLGGGDHGQPRAGFAGQGDVGSNSAGGGGGHNGVAQGITDWFLGAGNAYARTVNWLAGVGPEVSFYGPGTVEVRQMMGSPFAAETVAAFKAAGSPASGIQRNGGNGIFNPFAAGLFNPTRQFVGTYNVSVDPFGQDQVLVILQNQTSMTSASYHLFGSWSRSDFPFGGTVTQYYWWIEPAP